MISAKDFTKAEKNVMPGDAGLYICLLQAVVSKKNFLVYASYSPKTNPEFFKVNADVKEQYEVIAWVQIERADEIASQLQKPKQDEENV